jgi:hypothetical protein
VFNTTEEAASFFVLPPGNSTKLLLILAACPFQLPSMRGIIADKASCRERGLLLND